MKTQTVKQRQKEKGSYKGKSLEPGGGGRFARMVDQVKGQKGVTNPAGLAASIGRQKYGAEKFADMAKAGRKRSK